jgi:hypothetical protein
MPKYTNTGTSLIVVGSLRFEPKDTLETPIWLETLPTGISKLADAPYFNPTILSQKVSTTSTVTIPNVTESSYKVGVFVLSGEVSLKLNSDSGTARLLGAGMSFEAICVSRTINDLRFTISTGVAYVTVEKI